MRVMTGVNEFPILDGEGTDPEPVDREALARLDAARLAERPDLNSIGELGNAPAAERFTKAVSLAVSGARIDEMLAALSGGSAGDSDTATTTQPIEPRPDAAPFEHLRAAVDSYERSGGARPRMYLACMGAIATHVNFANWAKSFFEVAGIETVPSGALDGNEAQAGTFGEGGFEIAAVCAGRKEDPAEVAALVSALRDAGATYVYMVNSTPEINEASGADEVVKNGVDMEAVLTATLGRLGITVADRDRSGGQTGEGER
jgi:methylmalonyl-CoA mutase